MRSAILNYMIEREGFLEYLKASGRKEDVARRVICLVQVFEEFLYGRSNTVLDNATEGDLDAFIEFVDQEKGQFPRHDEIQPSAKSYLWALRYYYRYRKNDPLATYTAMQREKRIQRKPLLLKEFRGIHPDHLVALAAFKINNIDQMLQAGGTADGREHLAGQTGIPIANILELVNLSDLARIPGVKGIRARLYHDAGFDTVETLAGSEVEDVLRITQEFVRETGFDGIAPLPAEVSFTIKTARSLPVLVEV